MATVFKRGGKRAKGYWYASWSDHNGKRRTKCTRTSDKAAAERIAKKYEADAALRREGVIDATLDNIGKQARRPVEDHLRNFQAKMQAGSKTPEHITRTLGAIRAVCDHAGFELAQDITADGVNRFAEHLKGIGRAARTIQAHLTAIKSLTKWLTNNHKLPRDPLASVTKPDPKSDRRRERRMLLPEEWIRLLDATLKGPERNGMSGHERSLLYRTAIETALRSNELRSLTRGRLFLDEDQPYITCKSGSTKNRKTAKQYILQGLAAELKAYVQRKSPRAMVYQPADRTRMAEALRDDLADARGKWLSEAKSDPEERLRREQRDFLAEVNHEGEHVDFHCIRHTCGAWLAKAGCHPNVIKTVMRHSTITLTMDTYGHLFPDDQADAVLSLESVLAEVQRVELKATGTDGAQRGAARRSRQGAC